MVGGLCRYNAHKKEVSDSILVSSLSNRLLTSIDNNSGGNKYKLITAAAVGNGSSLYIYNKVSVF